MLIGPGTIEHEFRVFHMCCGIGGGAKGFRKANPRIPGMQGRFRNIGGIDVDPRAMEDFERLAGCKGTVLDLFSLEQYRDFHGHEPPPGWTPATTADIHRAAGHERPNVVFISAPCKGFSGLLAEKISATLKYQALNQLTLRCIFLLLEAFKDDPPEVILFENVPRIATRGRWLLDQIRALLSAYGYAVAETTHNCGAIGNMAQSRERFLMICRHREKVPPFIYEPRKFSLRGVGEILDKLPLPGDERAGPMHRMPALHWKTWVRLAFVEAGSDWRSLNRLRVENGYLADYALEPDTSWNRDVLGVRNWDEATGVITSRSSPTTGAFSVADPRAENFTDRGAYGVGEWQDPAATLTSQRSPGQGRFSIADPRIDGHPKSVQNGVLRYGDTAPTVTSSMFVGTGAHAVADPRVPGTPYNHVYRIVEYGSPATAISGAGPRNGAHVADPRLGCSEDAHCNKFAVRRADQPAFTVFGTNKGPGSGAGCVADPRPIDRPGYKSTKYRVTHREEPAGTVIGASTTGNGAFAVADVMPEALRNGREIYRTAGQYGVLPWNASAGAVQAQGQYDNGRWSVADGRPFEQPFHLPAANDKVVAIIRALDNTWHRPFTTFELAALQSLFDPEEWMDFRLAPAADSTHREWIGNLVPPDGAQGMAETIGVTLLLARAGQTFVLSNDPIWVQPQLPVQIALSVDIPELPI